MTRRSFFFLLPLTFLFVALGVSAQDVTTIDTAPEAPPPPPRDAIEEDIRTDVRQGSPGVLVSPIHRREKLPDSRVQLRGDDDSTKTDADDDREKPDTEKHRPVPSLLQRGTDQKVIMQEQRAAKERDFAEKREALRTEAQARRAELQERASTTRATRADALTDHRAQGEERITARVLRIVRRFEVALARLEHVGERIMTRIETLSSQGIDTQQAEELMRIARESLSSAGEHIDAILPTLERVLASENPREEIKHVKEIIRAAHDDLRKVHKLYREALQSLRNAVKDTPTDIPTPQ